LGFEQENEFVDQWMQGLKVPESACIHFFIGYKSINSKSMVGVGIL
jgi:hypothetical protein